MKKIRVGILFGGKSAEHEVSLQSAKNVLAALDRDKYEVVLIGIDKEGKWHWNQDSINLLNENDPKLIQLSPGQQELAVVPGSDGVRIVPVHGEGDIGLIDVVFPVLHGTYGEDGTVQGLLKLANIPFVGAGVLGSAVGMDKDVMKRLLRSDGIPVADFLTFTFADRENIDYDQVTARLGSPVFVKPANMGSSVGISKAKDRAGFEAAVDDAFQYDTKIIIEEFIKGREIECSVLGNENPIASLPGEILPQADFYSYEAKYIDEKGALLEIPAKLPDSKVKEIQDLAIRTYRSLCCEGMARVDMFLKDNGEILINEINTIPGFTKISMYPKLWEVSGLPYSKLIDRLIELALERFKREQALKTKVEI
ncbi:MAG TPA: D-alanine--D-alanine ligase [Clostridiales bacterium]|nr:D-alanine--D-alanine ligase [Clostridiales bacterium]